MKIAGITHKGCVRHQNEDAILMNESARLLVVADGMGGHAHGEIASRLVIDTFRSELAKAEAQHSPPDLHRIIKQAHHLILEEARSNRLNNGMGSTVIASYCQVESYTVSWVGDSRAYLWRQDFGLERITCDHSYVALLLQQGVVTPEEASSHSGRHIVMQSLGHGQPEPETVKGDWQPGDRLLLCSDGLNNELEDSQIEAIISSIKDRCLDNELQLVVQALLGSALKKGGRDNVSVIIAENTGR